MVDGSFEEHGRRRVRVVIGEGERELEGEALVGGLGRAGDGRRPGEQVAVRVREGGDAGRGRQHELHQFGLEANRSKFGQ